jgi:hypothetical protein
VLLLIIIAVIGWPLIINTKEFCDVAADDPLANPPVGALSLIDLYG